MDSHHFVSQLVLFVLIWLFILLHLNRPKCPVLVPATPTEPKPLKPKRQRSNVPQPFEGLTQKPPCALCVHARPRIPKRLLRYPPTRWRRRTGVLVRSIPPCTFVRTTVVTIGAGWGVAISGPMVIPAAVPGVSSTARHARGIFHIPLDLVVDQWTSESESSSNLDFVF